MKNFKQNKAFTLVELIVVITVLAILGTIAFISMQSYVKNSRDSVRISDLSILETQLQIYLFRVGKLPIPEDKIDFNSRGVLVGYQGYAGKDVLMLIKVFNGLIDPLNDSYYIYRTNALLTSYQLMSYLEDDTNFVKNNIISDTYAVDLKKRYPILKGNTLGILLDESTNLPIQDIENNTIEFKSNYKTVKMYLATKDEQVATMDSLFPKIEELAIHNYGRSIKKK